MFLGWRLIRVAMIVWPAMIFLETLGPFSRSRITFLTRSEFEALQTKYRKTHAEKENLQQQFDLKVEYEDPPTSSHPEKFSRKRKLSIMSNSSQMNSDWLTVIPPSNPFRFGTPRINGHHGKRLPLRKNQKPCASRYSDAVLITFDGADIKSILNNPTKFTEICGFSGVDTAYFKVDIY